MRENRKTAGRRTVCLLLAFALLLGVLPIRVFAQSGVDTVVQALQGFSASIGNRLIITPQGSTVTVTATQEWVSFEEKTLFLTIPEGVTVDWKATVSNSTLHTLIQMSEESRGTLRLTAGTITAGNSGDGIKVLAGNFELSGGTIDAGWSDSTGIWVQGSNSRFTFSSGTVIVGSFAQGLRISDGGTAEIKGGEILCNQSGAQAILVEGRSKLTISGGDIVLNNTGQALQISNGGTAEIKGGQILCSLSGAKAIVMEEKANLAISDGLIRCDAEDTIALSNQSTVTISGGMIRNSGESSGKFVLNASGDSSVTVTGGSIKGKINGFTDSNLKNGAGESVYKVTLEGLQPADPYTVELLSPQGYGVKGIDLRIDEKLYFYVPGGETEFKLKVGSKTYHGKANVQANHDNTVQMTDKYIEITEQPQSVTKTYAPNLEITLRVQATCENPITYQWYSKPDGTGSFTAIPNATSSTLTLRNLNAGETSYYCVLNAEGATEVRTEESLVKVTSATYTGKTTDNIYVKSSQVTENVTYTLPTLPQGMSWGAVTVGGTAALIDGAPTVSGNVLSFKTTAQPANTSATIKVNANGGTNYHDNVFTLTVTAQEKTGVQITGLTAEDATYDGQPHRGYSGNVQTTPNYAGTLEYKYTGRGTTNYPESTEAPTAAGEYTVTISVPSTDPEYIGSVSFDFAIAKRKVKVKADNKNMIAGQALPTLTYTVAGQVGNETALNGEPRLSVATDGKTPGNFEVNVDMTGVSYTANYEADNPASEKGMLAVQSPVQPRYEISVNPIEWDFGRVLQNELPRKKDFVIRNTGNQTLHSLKLSLSGKDADRFELSERNIERLSVRQQHIIEITPQRGLSAGVYYAVLEIQESYRISKKIPLEFTVVALPIDGEYREWEMKTEVPLTKEWNIRFNRKLDKTSVTKDNVFLVSALNPHIKILANLRLSEDGTIIHIQPKQPLDGQKKYFLIIQKLKDESGKLLKQNVVMPFKTV